MVLDGVLRYRKVKRNLLIGEVQLDHDSSLARGQARQGRSCLRVPPHITEAADDVFGQNHASVFSFDHHTADLLAVGFESNIARAAEGYGLKDIVDCFSQAPAMTLV